MRGFAPVSPLTRVIVLPVFKSGRPISVQRPKAVIRGLRGLGTPIQVLPQSAVSTIAGTIQQVEGYYPPGAVVGGVSYPSGSLAYQNNNPGNLRFVGQAGAVQGTGGFARFDSYDDGVNALNNQIQLYAGRGMTISDMMKVYAPSDDGNNPASYAATIAAALGVSADTPLPNLAGDAASSSDPFTDAFSGIFPDVFSGGADVLTAGSIGSIETIALAAAAGLLLYAIV